MKPRLLDLFCGAGGAAMGYHRAGFEVVGVDIRPQPRYPFEFHCLDFLEALTRDLGRFDAYHASPPCQKWSRMTKCRRGLSNEYPDFIAPVRQIFAARRLPYVIENVPGAPLVSPLLLCGQMFGLDLFRHRLFESNVELPFMLHGHSKVGSKAGQSAENGGWAPGRIISVAGNCAPIAEAKRAMGIDWMTRDELSQAIPPAYTAHIGAQLLRALGVAV